MPEPKKGVFITFTNSTFGERHVSDEPTRPKESTDPSGTFNSRDKMGCMSSESASSEAGFSTNDWLKFVWACENENVAALIDLFESNESSYIPVDRKCGSDCRSNQYEMINGLLLSQGIKSSKTQHEGLIFSGKSWKNISTKDEDTYGSSSKARVISDLGKATDEIVE